MLKTAVLPAVGMYPVVLMIVLPRTVSIQEGSDSGSRTSVIMQESGSPVTSQQGSRATFGTPL